MYDDIVKFINGKDYNVDFTADVELKCWQGAKDVDVASEYGFASLVYDPLKNIVYKVMIESKDKEQYLYVWVNQDYVEQYEQETNKKIFDELPKDRKWVSTDSFEDIITKTEAILNNKEYDHRVILTLDITDEIFMFIAKTAHDQDITFNKCVEMILRDTIENHKLT